MRRVRRAARGTAGGSETAPRGHDGPSATPNAKHRRSRSRARLPWDRLGHWWSSPVVRPPVPRLSAIVGVHPDVFLVRHPLVLKVVPAVLDERPSHAGTHHCGPEILSVGSAKRDDTVISIPVARLTGNGAAAHQFKHCLRCFNSSGPPVRTDLSCLRSVDAPYAVRCAVELDCVAVGNGLAVCLTANPDYRERTAEML